MAYVKQLSKVGNSAALIIDRPFLDQLNLSVGAEVEVSVEKNSIVVRPHRYAEDTSVKASATRMLGKHRKSLERLAR
jgi:antitoxin component of MazEF toxin-antitoxin module